MKEFDIVEAIHWGKGIHGDEGHKDNHNRDNFGGIGKTLLFDIMEENDEAKECIDEDVHDAVFWCILCLCGYICLLVNSHS